MKPFLLVLGLVGGVAVLSEVTVDSELRTRNGNLAQELQQMQSGNRRLNAEVDTIKADIERLRTTPEEALFQARTTLGMVGSGEVIYQVVSKASEREDGHGPK